MLTIVELAQKIPTLLDIKVGNGRRTNYHLSHCEAYGFCHQASKVCFIACELA